MFEDRFSKEIADLLEHLFTKSESRPSGSLAGNICDELVKLPKNIKKQPLVVAEALGQAAQKNPFADLTSVAWHIHLMCKEIDDFTKYHNILFGIGRACNDIISPHPKLGLSEAGEAANNRCGNNQVYVLTKTYDNYSHYPLDVALIVSMLEFQLEMCFSPHKQAVLKAQELLKKVAQEQFKAILEFPMGPPHKWREPKIPLETLSGFFQTLLTRGEKAESGKEEGIFLTAAESMAYGIIKTKGAREIALSILHNQQFEDATSSK